MSEVKPNPIQLHVRVARIANVDARAALNYLTKTPKRVDYRVARLVVLALRQLREPVPERLHWAEELVDVSPLPAEGK